MALDMAAVDVRADSTSPAQAAVAALLGSALVGSVCVAWNRATPIIPSGQEGIPTTSVARVVELWVYPVKGMKGIQLQEAALRRGPAGGFLWDRRFMVVDAGGNCVTQRELPALATVTTALEDTTPGSWYGSRAKWLTLTSPVGSCVSVPCESGVAAEDWETSPRFCSVTIWGDTVRAEDCGEAAAAFLGKTLGRDGLRLVRFAGQRPSAELGSRAPTQTARGFSGPRAPIYGTAFSDQYQFMLASAASLASLNNRIARRDVRSTVGMGRFRPNIVVKGSRPWTEDRWVTFQLLAPGKGRGNDVRFHVVKPAARCSSTTNDQNTGETSARNEGDMEPLRTLQTFRTGAQIKGWSSELPEDRVFFGTYLVRFCSLLPHFLDFWDSSSAQNGWAGGGGCGWGGTRGGGEPNDGGGWRRGDRDVMARA